MPALAIAEALARACADVEPVLSARCAASRRDCSQPGVPVPPAAVRADLPPDVVEERPLAFHGAATCSARSGGLFEAERPVAVLGTGGYASAPVVWWATRHGSRPRCRSRTRTPDSATRLLSRRVRHVYLGLRRPVAAPLRARRRGRSTPGTQSPRRRPSGGRRRWPTSASRDAAGGARDRRQPGRARARPARSPAGSTRAGRRGSGPSLGHGSRHP